MAANLESGLAGDAAHFVLADPAQGEAQEGKLLFGRRVEEIALVARGIDRAVQFDAAGTVDPAHIMAGRQAIGAELARHGEQIGELRPHVAQDAGDRRAPGEIVVGEALDHFLAEARFVIEDIVSDAQPVGDRARVADIVARTACPLAAGGGAVIVKLQRHADNFRAARRRQRGHDRTVDAARHGDDYPLSSHRPRQLEQAARVVSDRY